MELKSLKCPNCGGILDVEDGLDTFFCKYCGHKIILTGQSEAAYKAKTKAKEFQHKQNTQERKYQNEHDRWEREETSKERAFKRETKVGIICLSVFVGSILLGVLPASIVGLSHKSRVRELKKIEQQIEDCIEDDDYDRALLLTNRLRLNDDWSHEETAEWDERREEYIRLIRRAQREDGDYEFIRVPFDCTDCDDYTKTEMIEILADAGFENIDAESVEGSAGWFSRSHIVEHVTIDGISEFSNRDEFVSDAEIIIYYYED